jgi:hypothetical protein
MTDPLRSDRPPASGETPERDREARVEELLLAGLDHYFSGQHDLAINVWTRVLFLDRGHARARAYIERARGAVSEQQREGDELFHTGAAALKRGDRAAARQLLTSALDRGASGEEALALLHRLDRLDAAAVGGEAPASIRSARPATDAGTAGRERDRRLAWVGGGIAAGILIAVVAAGYLSIVADPFELNDGRRNVPPTVEEPLPVPPPCEIRLARARDLFTKGRPHEALAVLEPGDPDDRHQAAYDSLRGAIQRQLLQAGRAGEPPGQPTRR